jgi:glycosyltransferase involved in cell wall biosynthesis
MGRNEGIPRSILEAMACGKPVIAAPNSGIPDVIEDGINGFLVNNNQPNLLAEKIVTLLNDEKYRENIGKSARKTIEEKFSWESFVEQITKLFRDALV